MTRAALILPALVLLLAGCSSSSSAERLDEAPPELEGLAGPEMEPTVVWSEDGKSWLFLTFASSTCPNEPRDIREAGDRTFEVTLESTGGVYCTADIGPAMYKFPAPVSPGAPVTVDLGYGVIVTL
ncbi:hypothetical protein [Microbacterium sp.]|uniref:hypothetical protein n=1 Tax=Microbacterium sp. TaxID=51671 RepID=UPI002734AAB3|nr:hypothetical protein [Microbacterium sp.]MDP3952038.1 hypothetical protein [Microbacterium sp.]